MAKKKSTSRKPSAKSAAKRPKRKIVASGTATARSKKRKTASKSTGKAVKKKTAESKVGTKQVATKTSGKKTSGKKIASKKIASKISAPITPPPPKMPKTRLNGKQLDEFKDRLLAKRGELLRDVRMLTKDALGKSRMDSAGDLSSMPIHMADIGSDNWEQDFTLGLIANERDLVREIDDALRRIENRTYGICLVTHKPITVARLRARPWAKYCIEYARQRETRGR